MITGAIIALAGVIIGAVMFSAGHIAGRDSKKERDDA